LRHIQYKRIAKRRAIATLAIFRPRRISKWKYLLRHSGMLRADNNVVWMVGVLFAAEQICVRRKRWLQAVNIDSGHGKERCLDFSAGGVRLTTRANLLAQFKRREEKNHEEQ
jgi:hypothetical protein